MRIRKDALHASKPELLTAMAICSRPLNTGADVSMAKAMSCRFEVRIVAIQVPSDSA